MARLDHLNARLGARRTGLLGPAGLAAILARPGHEARLDALRATPAGRTLPRDLPAGAEGLALAEAALREGARAEACRLLALVDGHRARALLGAFLDLDAASAVAAVLRGAVHGIPPAATLAAAPAVPGLPEPLLQVAVRAAGPAEAWSRLVAVLPWIEPAGPAPARGDPGALARAERDLAATAFSRAQEACRGAGEDGRLLAAHLACRIDAVNARTLLALAAPAAAPAPAPAAAPGDGASAGARAGAGDGAAVGRRAFTRWIPGGKRLSPDWLDALRGAPAAAARDAIGAAFGFAPEVLQTPAGAERALALALLRPLRRAARTFPLSLAVPLAYVVERREEARAAALVLRGTWLGLPADELLSLLGDAP